MAFLRLNNISISRKLYFTIGFTALLVTIELCTLWFAITTLSAVRSYVSGEGLWSKAQKDAVMNLRRYAQTQDENDYEEFKRFLEVPYGDKAARLELMKSMPDFEKARQHFIQGRNHPDDVDGMINLLMRFHDVSYLKRAFTAWANAEPALEKLIVIGENLHDLVAQGADQEEIQVLLKEVDHINVQLTGLEDNFSYTLGEGARWLEGLVLKVVMALSLTIGTATVLLSVSINRNLKRGVDAIIEGSARVGSGLLSERVQVFSSDEIGTVAMAFNEMTATVERNKNARREFLLNMSHEVRTPMNAILGFSRHLIETEYNKERRLSLQLIIESGDRLLQALNKALEQLEIEKGGAVMQTVETTTYEERNEDWGKGIRVLVVEDNEINLMLVQKLLEKRGFEVLAAENGRVALQRLEEAGADIVLMDLQMPEMDGYEASSRIRGLPSEKAAVPIIAMTAHTVTGDRERCLEIGINEYISKPYRAAELYSKLSEALYGRSSISAGQAPGP